MTRKLTAQEAVEKYNRESIGNYINYYLLEDVIGNVRYQELADAWWEISEHCSSSIKLSEILPKELKKTMVKSAQEIRRNKEGYYPYIPYNPKDFIKDLSSVRRKFGADSFLDVGAGIGDKVFLAGKIGYSVYEGLEYFSGYVKIARKLGISVNLADAFDFKRYSEFQLIYMYHPIQNPALYLAMVMKILDEMAVGTFLLEVLNYDLKYYLRDFPRTDIEVVSLTKCPDDSRIIVRKKEEGVLNIELEKIKAQLIVAKNNLFSKEVRYSDHQ